MKRPELEIDTLSQNIEVQGLGEAVQGSGEGNSQKCAMNSFKHLTICSTELCAAIVLLQHHVEA